MKLLAALVAGVLVAASGCARQAPPNVVLVVIDTLRHDRVGAHGDTRGLTPFIDSLAARGTVFQRAYAQSSWTNASVATIMTSRYQSQHWVTSFNATLAEQELTLAEILKQHGYATAGFSANFLVQGKLGFGQGFDEYEVYARQMPPDWRGKRSLYKERAEKIDAESLAWLDRHPAGPPRPPVFLYLHYMEPHNPYDPPLENLDRVLAGRKRPDVEFLNNHMTLSNVATFDDEMVQGVRDLYDAEVMTVDQRLREQFAELERRGLLERAVVIVTADHGEEFKEHGLMGHHQTLFEEVLRVPLIILVPGQTARRDVDEPVALIDLAPTVLDLAGIAPPPSFEGRSLRPLIDPIAARPPFWRRLLGDGEPRPRPEYIFSELIKEGTQRQRPHERAVVVGSGKLIAGVGGEREYYDLAADPGETNPDALAEDGRAALTAGLGHLGTYAARKAERTPAGALDADTAERMRALGYAD